MAIRLTGLASGLDTEAIVQDLMSIQRLKTSSIQKNITKLEWTQEKWKQLNNKIYSFYTGPLSKMKAQGTFNAKKASSSNQDKLEVNAGLNAPEGVHNIKINSLASFQYVTGDKIVTKDGEKVTESTLLTELGFDAEAKTKITIKTLGESEAVELPIDDKTTIGNLVAKLRKAGLNASFDTTHGRFFISSKNSGKNYAFTITQSNETVDGSLSSLGLGVIVQDPDGNIVSSNSKVALVQASDAEIVYNNAVLTSDSNNFTVNGLNIVAKEITAENEVLKINVTKDTEAVYNTIKDFVKTYNELITEMNSAYYADSARGYDPLTDDEKAQMTDKQIEQWEDKIKTSLLRRDNTLSKVITSMRNELGKSLDLDGEKYSLASLGIVTGDYQEKGLLHIEGDSDDPTVATKENKLMKALSEDPDLVMKVFNKLTGDLYETMSEQMKSTELSSALTFYNDKAMKEKVTDYKKELAKLENRLLDIEERYYKQFSAMEAALQKLNSQSNYLASMLGTGTY